MIRYPIRTRELEISRLKSTGTPPSLPSSFQGKTIHSPEDAEIFVRSAGSGPVAVLLHGYAENSDS